MLSTDSRHRIKARDGEDEKIIVLLVGGDKPSQQKDIKKVNEIGGK